MTDLIQKQIIDNIKQWSNGRKKGPVLATFRVTNICDLKCKFCTAKDEKPLKDELNIGNYKKLFYYLNKLKVKLCAIVGGGEALCKKDLTLEIIRLIKKYNMNGWLVTNGVNFDSKSIKELIRLRFDTILFSIDGADAETHDYLRGKKGCFNKAVKNMRIFNRLKNGMGSNKPQLKIQMLVTNKNYKQIKEMLYLAKSLKTDQLILNFLVNHTSECIKLQLDKVETRRLGRKLKELLKDSKNDSFTNFHDFIEILDGTNLVKNKYNNLESSYCFQPWYHLNVTENGYINFCPELHKWQKDTIKEKNIKDIWYGKNITNFRNMILNNRLFNMCKKYCNMPILVENKKILRLIKNG